MMSVRMVSGPLKSEYTWGIKNYINGLLENMSGVSISLSEISSGPLRIASHNAFPEDVVHFASQTFGHMAKHEKNSIITCHDLMAFSAPNMFDKKTHAVFSRMAIKGMDKCDKIISVSEHTKNEIVRFLGAEEEKIEVIYSGINKGFKPRRRKNDTDYIVYFGSEEKRKNVAALIDAFHALKMSHPQLKLVKNYKNPEIWKKILSMGLAKDVIVTGNLTQEQMAEYYSNAKAFVYPSLFEGFGFTPLEAMACGCPVAASNTTAVPEILGDAAIYFDPRSPLDMAEKISMMIDDKWLSRKMSGKSLARAKKFSWKETAKKTRKVYEEAMK